MNTQQLIDRVKFRLDDKIAPRVFNDTDVLMALNDAQNEFALRTLCIFDGESSVDVTSNSPWAQLPAGTCSVIAAWLEEASPLRLVNQHELEFGYFELDGVEANTRHSGWRSATGTPEYLVTDLGPQTVRLVPKPTTGDLLYVERYRLPVAMAQAAGATAEVSPEIAEAYHPDLVIGALAYMFAVPDSEVADKQAAADNRTAWENRLQIAQQLLRTTLRTQIRAIPPPPDTAFVQPLGNTNGAAQNVNTGS
jgi:hypothetical protein